VGCERDWPQSKGKWLLGSDGPGEVLKFQAIAPIMVPTRTRTAFYTLLLLINILLLILGTFMDLAPMLLIATPILLPIAKQFGVDPVHFGIIMILNLGIGLLTPPVGSTLAVGCAVGKVSMEALSRSIVIFYVPMLIVLGLVNYIPAITLWLPSVILAR
jgi:TRAP-type C4-dicarboxylate transport system permease large subunit